MGLFSSILGLKDAPSSRTVSAEETAALQAQNESLEKLDEIADSQFDLSQEQIDKYKAAFEDPNNLATDEIAEFQSLITGKKVKPSDLAGKSLEDIIRETMLQAPASFQRQAEDYISKTDTLSKQFGTQTKLNTDKLVSSLQDAGYKYQTALSETAEKLGTIDKKILAEETGATTAGISTAFAESQKGLEASMARRGLAGSGLDAQASAALAAQEASTKYSALAQARQQARGLSDQLRMQQLGLSGQMYQAGMQTAQGIYGAQQQGGTTIYQTGMGQAQGTLSARNTAATQGLGSLGQVYGYGQQQLAQGAGLGSQAGSLIASAASGYGGIAQSQIQQSQAQYQQQVAQAKSKNAAIGGLVGTVAGGAIGYGLGGGWQGVTALSQIGGKIGG